MHKESKGLDRDKLVGALETIFGELVGGELETVRQATDELRSSLSERLESVTEFATQALEQTKKDVSSRIDGIMPKLDAIEKAHEKSIAELGDLDPRLSELEKIQKDSSAKVDDLVPRFTELEKAQRDSEQAHTKSMGEIGERADQSFGELRQELEGQLQSFKGQLEGSLSSEAEKTRDALGGLEQKYSDLEAALEQHRQNTERLSGLLKSMASVFSGDAKSTQTAPATAPPKQSAAKPTQKEAPQLPVDPVVEDVLARVFPDES